MNHKFIRRSTLALIALSIFLAVFGTLLFAAGESKTSAADVYTPDPVTMNKVGDTWVTIYTNATFVQGDAKFTAGQVEQVTQNKAHVLTCTGNPKYTAPENTITADKLVAYTTPRSADFSGNVKAIHNSGKQGDGGKLLGNAATTVTSQRLTYDYGKKWAEFSGGEVTMLHSPKGNGGNQGDIKGEMSKEPSTLTCDKLQYDYANKKAFATGTSGHQVHVVQKDRELWSDEATYDEDTSIVVLKGNFVMKNTGEEELKSIENVDVVTISLDNDWIKMIAQPGKSMKFHLLLKDE